MNTHESDDFQSPLYPEVSPYDDLHGAIAREPQTPSDISDAIRRIHGDPNVPDQSGSLAQFTGEVLASAPSEADSTWMVQITQTAIGLRDFGSQLSFKEPRPAKVTPSRFKEDSAKMVMFYKGLGVVQNALDLGFSSQSAQSPSQEPGQTSAIDIAKRLLLKPSISEPEKKFSESAEKAFTTLLGDMIKLIESYKRPKETTTGLIQEVRANLAKQLGHNPRKAKDTINQDYADKAREFLTKKTPKQLGKTALRPN